MQIWQLRMRSCRDTDFKVQNHHGSLVLFDTVCDTGKKKITFTPLSICAIYKWNSALFRSALLMFYLFSMCFVFLCFFQSKDEWIFFVTFATSHFSHMRSFLRHFLQRTNLRWFKSRTGNYTLIWLRDHPTCISYVWSSLPKFSIFHDFVFVVCKLS